MSGEIERKMLLGIKERAERLAAERAAEAPSPGTDAVSANQPRQGQVGAPTRL